MDIKFDHLPWHDSELLSINIDRASAGYNDTVVLAVKWRDGRAGKITFKDCYFFDARMNFGVVADESILEGWCLRESDQISEVKTKWSSLGVDLDELSCYRIITNSTNSKIDIYALSFELE